MSGAGRGVCACGRDGVTVKGDRDVCLHHAPNPRRPAPSGEAAE